MKPRKRIAAGRVIGRIAAGIDLLAVCCFLMAISPVIEAAALAGEAEAVFDANGFAGLKAGGVDLPATAGVKLSRVVTADRCRDIMSEPEPLMYAGEDRTFTDAGVQVLTRTFDAQRKLERQTYDWGSVTVEYQTTPHGVDFRIDVSNQSEKVIELVELTLMELQFPQEVSSKYLNTLRGSGCNLEGPDLVGASYEGGQLLWLSKQPNRPISQQLVPLADNRLAINVSAGHEKGGREIYDMLWNTRPIRPGESDVYELTLRFGMVEDNPYELAGDVLRAFAEAFPQVLRWHDRRPIVQVWVSNDRWRTEKNPRGYYPYGVHDFDVNDKDTYKVFYDSLMEGADMRIKCCRNIGAQGVIVWDIEGMQDPALAYYGEPRILPHAAPEMDAAVDDFFNRLKAAGLRVGVTVRPTLILPMAKREGGGPPDYNITWDDDWALSGRKWMGEIKPGDGRTTTVPASSRHIYEQKEFWCGLTRLHNKIVYAKERWGATLFYVDVTSLWRPRDRSTADGAWASKRFSARLYSELQRRHPDVLLIPEHQHFEHHAYSAPYTQAPRFGTNTGPEIRAAYPESFSVMNARTHVTENPDDYTRWLVSGDVLFTGVSWWTGKLSHIAAYEPAAALAPFQVLLTKDNITLNREAFADAAALAVHLAVLLAGDRPLPQRRVFVRYTRDVSADDLRAALDAIMKANGIIAWTQPNDGDWRDWRGFWEPDNPFPSLTEGARALTANEGDNAAKVFIANSVNEARVVSFEVHIEKLGIGATKADDIRIQHLDGLTPAQVALPEDIQAIHTEEDDMAESLLRAIEADAHQEAKAQVSLDDFEFDQQNFWFQDNILHLLVEPMRYRVLRFSRK